MNITEFIYWKHNKQNFICSAVTENSDKYKTTKLLAVNTTKTTTFHLQHNNWKTQHSICSLTMNKYEHLVSQFLIMTK